MVDTYSTEPARHRAPEDLPSFSGDLATAYDHIRAHLLREQSRQQIWVSMTQNRVTRLRRRHGRPIGSATVGQIEDADRELRDAQVVARYIAEQLAGFPELNRDVAS